MRPLRLIIGAIAAIGLQFVKAANPPVPVPLEDVVLRALENNLELKIERVEPVIAHQGVRVAEADFDPVADFSMQRLDSQRFVNNILELSPELAGGTINEVRYTPQGSVQERLSTGAQYSFSAVTPVIDTDYPLRIFDRSYTPLVVAEISQPVLRDSGRRINRVHIDQARLRERESVQGIAAKMLSVIRDVEIAYCTVSDAERHLELTTEDLEICERRVARSKTMASAGLASPPETRSAAIAVEERRADLAQASADLARARVRLRSLLADEGEGETGTPIQPVRNLPEDPPPAELGPLVSLALLNRPEIRSQELAIERLQMDVDLANNDRRPRLDLLGLVSYGGLAGTDPVSRPLIQVPPDLVARDGFFGAFKDGAFSWSVGFSMSIPIGSREALARLESSRRRVDQERLRLSLLRNRIGADVELAFHAATAAWARLQSNRRLVDLARENLRDQEQRLEIGLSTEFDVLDARDRLTTAEDRQGHSGLTYALARFDIAAVSGTSFETYHLQTSAD